MASPSSALQRLLACGEEGDAPAERVRRRLGHDQMCDMYGVKGAPEEGFARHQGQGFDGVDDVVRVESAGTAGQERASFATLG